MASTRDYQDSEVQPVAFSDAPEAQEALQAAASGFTIDVDEGPNTELKAKVERFADLLELGKKPGEAAEAIGTTLKAINTQADMREAVTKLLTKANLGGKVREAIAKSALNVVLMKNYDSDNVKEQKLALEAAKLVLGSEGHAMGDKTEVTFDLGSLAPLMKEDVSLPGITLDVTEEKEIDVT